jgi:hypothetical protein
MLPIQILAPPEPDVDIDAKAACAFRDLVKDAKQFALDFLYTESPTAHNWVMPNVVEPALREMASILNKLSHRPVTQFYEAEIVRLRELVKQQELTIQALGKAVAERETVGAR